MRQLWEQFVGAKLHPLGVPTSGVVDPWLSAAGIPVRAI